MDEQRNSERIALYLGWKVQLGSPGHQLWHSPECENSGVKILERPNFRSTCSCLEFDPPNFHTDESASAMLLEAMREDEPSLTFNDDIDRWEITLLKGLDPVDAETTAEHSDRKTCVVMAFLKFMEAHPRVNLSVKE